MVVAIEAVVDANACGAVVAVFAIVGICIVSGLCTVVVVVVVDRFGCFAAAAALLTGAVALAATALLLRFKRGDRRGERTLRSSGESRGEPQVIVQVLSSSSSSLLSLKSNDITQKNAENGVQ
jgi:uncharacterized membrane protein YbhN (UPF0104 family)